MSPDTLDASAEVAMTVGFMGVNHALGSGGVWLAIEALAWKWNKKAI